MSSKTGFVGVYVNGIPVHKKLGPDEKVLSDDGKEFALYGEDNKLPDQHVPNLAIINTHVVNSLEEMLAITAETGDIAIRKDIKQTFILQGTDPKIESNWVAFETPENNITTVFGRSGDVTAQAGDYSADLISFSRVNGIQVDNVQLAIETLQLKKANVEHFHDAEELNITYRKSFENSDEVIVNHNLGYVPSVVVIDSMGYVCITEVQHIDDNTFISTTNGPISGTIFCS
jgi:hypothetical protein